MSVLSSLVHEAMFLELWMLIAVVSEVTGHNQVPGLVCLLGYVSLAFRS